MHGPDGGNGIGRVQIMRRNHLPKSGFSLFRTGTTLLVLWAAIGCSKTVHETVHENSGPEINPNLQYVLQYGSGYESGHAVAVDGSGNSYVTGRTSGNLAGTGLIGGSDVFVAKYDSAGARLWIRQIGTPENDEGDGIAVDAAGNSYITGYTEGDLDGGGNDGGADVFIAKLDTGGNLMWTKQIGTIATEIGYGIAADADGNAYIAGFTRGLLAGLAIIGVEDAFVAKYDTNGNPVWIKQFGSLLSDSAHGVAIDASGNSYVTGATYGDMGGTGNAGSADPFVAKFDEGGQKIWVRQVGSTELDSGEGIAADANGNSTVTGYAWGNLPGGSNAGYRDGFVARYDPNGDLQWLRQFGTETSDEGTGIAMDAIGNAVITGYTAGNLDGSLETGTGGNNNPFIITYDAFGNQVSITLVDSVGEDAGNGIALDSSGNATLTGYADGNLAGTGYAGREDVFIARYGANGDSFWIRQMGVTEADRTYDIVADDARGAYMAGSTTGAFREDGQIGKTDAFILEETVFGQYPVILQFGSDGNDAAHGLAVTGGGTVIVTGSTDGDMEGTGNAGGTDIFIARRYDAFGLFDWTRQLGTAGDDAGYGIAMNPEDNSTLTTGKTAGDLTGAGSAGGDDVFIVKYSITGDLLWIKQFGSAGDDVGRRIGLDSTGNIYITGTTDGDLAGTGNAGGDDAFVVKLDPDGNTLWIRQFGTADNDRAADIAVHPFGDSFVTGATDGDMAGNENAGGDDAFVVKLDPDGNTVWTRQFGTAADDGGTGVVVDPFGDATVTGTTEGDLAGTGNAGASDAFVSKFDGDGNLAWIEQTGTEMDDVPMSIDLDSDGDLDVAGYTAGDLSGEGRAGGEDVFFARFLP
jgi:hypothetical protein